MRAPATFRLASVPGNSERWLIHDSTRRRGIDSFGAFTAQQAPGPMRGHPSTNGKRVVVRCAPTGQAVTLNFYRMKNPGLATTGAWALDPDAPDTGGTGTVTIAAGDSKVFNWLPGTEDHAVELVAGATGPTTCPASVTIICDRSSGL